MNNWQKNLSHCWGRPSKLYLEKQRLDTKLKQTYADLDELIVLKVNCRTQEGQTAIHKVDFGR